MNVGNGKNENGADGANGFRLPLDHVHGAEYAGMTSSEHRNRALAKMDSWIKVGTSRGVQIVERILSETPLDRLAPVGACDYKPAAEGSGVMMVLPDGSELAVHKHALGQISARVGLPSHYATALRDGDNWRRELLAHNLRELHQHAPREDRYLVRAVNGQARAALSDRYRRLDARPSLDSMLGTLREVGAQVVDGLASDTRVSIRAIVPRIVEPVPGDYTVLGLGWSNSDFGDGALAFNLFIMRLVCLNGAMAESALRRVHLGGKLGESIAFSEQTYALDSQTIASASRDVVKSLLSPEKMGETVKRIAAAASERVDGKAEIAKLRASDKLGKGEAEKVVEAFTAADIEVLPPGQNKWRFSNALSFLARDTEDPTRRMELEHLAGSYVELPKAA